MIKTFQNEKGDVLAYFFSLDYLKGNIFPTLDELPMQFGFSENLESRSIKKHIHKKVNRYLDTTSEFIFVLEGKIKIKLFDESGVFISDVILTSNQAILQYIGGHSFEITKGTRFFEIKQGPYLGPEIDKYYEDTSK